MQRGRLPPDGTFAKGVSYSNIQRRRLPPYRLGYARRFMMVGPPGLEPGTPRLKAGCSDVRATDPKGGGQRVFAHQPFRSCAATPLDATITRDAMRKNQPAYIWSRERDLNPQLSDYKSGALRLELSRHKWWTGVDSNHRGKSQVLQTCAIDDYATCPKFSAARGIRTPTRRGLNPLPLPCALE